MNNKSIILKLSELLIDIDWKLVGSSNLSLQGIDVIAKDVDILIPLESVDFVNALLSDYMVHPINLSETDDYRSYFGQFIIEGTLVEIMSELIFKKSGSSKNIYKDIIVKLGNAEIKCACLENEYDIAIIRGKQEKAAMIMNYIQYNTVKLCNN